MWTCPDKIWSESFCKQSTISENNISIVNAIIINKIIFFTFLFITQILCIVIYNVKSISTFAEYESRCFAIGDDISD